MVFNAVVTSIYIILGSFRNLVTFKGITEYTIYTLTCICALILRYRKTLAPSSPAVLSSTPNEQNQLYRTYTFSPIVFSCIGTVLVVKGVISEPMIGIGIVSIVASGRVLYTWKRKGRDQVVV